VTEVLPAELDALVPLWDDLRTQHESGPYPVGGLDRLHDRMSGDDPRAGIHVVAAWQAGRPVGIATMSLQDAGPWWEPPSVLVSLLYVTQDARRRGVGQALLAEAATFAEAWGTDDVTVNVPPQQREVQRFFARLGFSPYVTRRVTSAAVLRRRLLGDTRGRLVDLRVRQHSLRVRARRAAGARGTTAGSATQA
jgi:GNAT superfamily N-acetyltransferase